MSGAVNKRSIIFELVGPAGAGKTTLLKSLSLTDNGIRAGFTISKHHYVRTAFLLLPTFVRLHQPFKGIRVKEMKRILYLQTLHRLLQFELSKGYRAIVLDEGPVYMLSRLKVFGGDHLQGLSFEKWWQSAIDMWSKTLDAIIRLDANDAVLITRISERNQPYPVQDMSTSSLAKFFASYRAAFEQVIAEMTAANGPKVIKFVTDTTPTEQIANEISLRLT